MAKSSKRPGKRRPVQTTKVQETPVVKALSKSDRDRQARQQILDDTLKQVPAGLVEAALPHLRRWIRLDPPGSPLEPLKSSDFIKVYKALMVGKGFVKSGDRYICQSAINASSPQSSLEKQELLNGTSIAPLSVRRLPENPDQSGLAHMLAARHSHAAIGNLATSE